MSAATDADSGGARAHGRRRRKVVVIAAAMTVVGLGGVVTLATWNDTDNASATFTAGSFDLEGSTDGTTYASHPTSGTAASLTFTLSPTAYNNLTPNDTVYAPLALRLAAGTTSNASLVHAVPTASGANAGNLTYSLVHTATFGCSAAVIAGAAAADRLVTNQALTVGGNGGNTYTLSDGSPTSNPGAPSYFCFAVTAGSGLTQGASATVTWTFTATST